MQKKQPTPETKAEIKKLAKRLNDSLYRIEKRGLNDKSKIYKAITEKTGKSRVTGSTRGMTESEAKAYKRELKRLLSSKTRTVSGTRAAISKQAAAVKKSAQERKEMRYKKAEVRRILGLPQPKYNPTDRYKEELRKKVRKVNASLARLEKAGLQTESAEYQMVSHYAIDKESKMYNYNLEKGTIRATMDFDRFTNPSELYRYGEVLDQIINAQTRTVTGTREAIEKGRQKYLSSETAKVKPELDYDSYRNIFKIYRTKVDPDKKNHVGSSTVLKLIRNTNFYQLTDEQIEDALRYKVLEDKTNTRMRYRNNKWYDKERTS